MLDAGKKHLLLLKSSSISVQSSKYFKNKCKGICQVVLFISPHTVTVNNYAPRCKHHFGPLINASASALSSWKYIGVVEFFRCAFHEIVHLPYLFIPPL
jgi:hypothetical protein